MCVGGSYYPTAKDFIEEANVQGISKRVPSVPNNLGPKDRIWFAHDAFEYLERAGTAGPAWKRRYGKPAELSVFGYVDGLQVEFVGNEILELTVKPHLQVVLVDVAALKKEKERGCGTRMFGATYLCTVRKTRVFNVTPLIKCSELGIKSRFLGYRYIMREKINKLLGIVETAAPPKQNRKKAVKNKSTTR